MKTIYITILSILWATISFAQNDVNYQYDNEGRIIYSDDGTKVQQYQYDNLGNRTAYSVVSSANMLIDLTVNSINLPNTNLEQGQSYAVSCTVQNTGTSEATNAVLKVYLSSNTTGTDVLVGSHTVSSITANANQNINLNINIPNSATLGNQYLVFFIDATESITETDETNNKDSIAVVVTELSLAELNIQNATLGANNVQAGNSINLTANINNDGTVSANNFTVKCYLSNNITYEANDLLLSNTTETIASLNASNTVAYNKTALIPSNTIAGNYYLLFVVDADNVVTETDETNNVYAVSLIVTNTNSAPVTDFVANQTNIAVGTTVQFIDQSTNNPTGWLWTFDGGTPSTSTQQNPQVTYNTPGTYDVTLVATNANGSSTEIKNGYITVGDCQKEWANLGSGGFSSGNASRVRLEFDNNNIPYVLFRDSDHNNKTTVMKYVNGSWQLVGNPGFSHVPVYDIELAIAPDNTPYVGYIDAVSSDNKISVKKFNGTSWVNVGQLNFSGRTDYVFDMTIDNNGYPAVIYEDGSYGGSSNWYWELMVKKFNGSSWVYATPVQLERGGYCDLKYNSNNELFVAYMSYNTQKANVKKLVGSNWVTVGTENFSSDKVESISLDFDTNDIPYVAYKDFGNSKKTTVKKLVNNVWTNVGNPGFSPDDITWYQKLVVSSDNVPYVSFRYYSPSVSSSNMTAVMKFENGSWVNVGNTNFTNAPAYYQILGLDNNNIPHLAYVDGSNASKISVMKYDCNENIETDFYANHTTTTIGSIVSFTDASTNSPTSWSWSFSPNTVSYVNGTNSTSQNPEVTFDAVGSYSVTLTASNSSSTDTEVKTDYIQIYQPDPVTYVPDDNFENYLETHDASGNTVAIGDANSMGNGVANDDYVFTSRISNVTDLDIHAKNISDLTGIEDFAALHILYCYNNHLTSIDVTQNAQLRQLVVYENQLTSLNVKQNIMLERLACNDNQLTELNVSQNTVLQRLFCYNNLLTELDISHNTALTVLTAFNNQLSSLDVSHNLALDALSCSNNQLSSLDVSQNTALSNFHCDNNQLTNLDVSQNSALVYLYCHENQLTDLDVSQNPNLYFLWVHNNNLSSLNVQNGHNTQLTGTSYGHQKFRATGNPNLTCIFVDNSNYSTNNWPDIDPQSHFVENQLQCDALSDNTPPIANCQSIDVYLDANGTATINAQDLDNGSTDNVGIASYSVTPDTVDCSDIGQKQVTFTVTDVAGNSDFCTTTVNVIDNIAPTSPQNLNVTNITETTADISFDPSSDNCSFEYEIYLNGNLITTTNTTSYSLTGLTQGTAYTVEVKAVDSSNNSSSGVSISFNTVAGVNETTISGLIIYPNPTDNILNITADETIKNISITNSLGQKVYDKKTNAKRVQLSLDIFANGAYFVKINSATGSVVKVIFKK